MDYETFVVRIRLDKRQSLDEGQITHVGTQETSYFRDLEAAVDFIKDHLDTTSGRARNCDQWGYTNLPMREASDADRD